MPIRVDDWTTDALVELCREIRAGSVKVGVEQVELTEALADELVKVWTDHHGESRPPKGIVRRLRAASWLMLEVAMKLTARVSAQWEGLAETNPKTALVSREHSDLIARVADAARQLPWREYCPRSLGPIRSQALAESKRDTVAGFHRAGLLLRLEAETHFARYQLSAAGDPQLLLHLDETYVMLHLAQAGTFCRNAEWTIARTDPRNDKSRTSEKVRLKKLFTDINYGAEHGIDSIARVSHIDETAGLVTAVDEDRFTLDTAYRNPGIMTARAFLLMYPITALLEKQGRRPWFGNGRRREYHATWSEVREHLLRGFVDAYRAIEHEGSSAPLTADFERSVVQLRLHLALINPGFKLTSEHHFADCLGRSVLDQAAVEELSRWLADSNPTTGKRRGDANAIGSVTMPSYLEGIRLTLGENSTAWQYYVSWRRDWFALDRYADESDRKGLVTLVLDSLT